jgi:general secretion pathway protein D
MRSTFARMALAAVVGATMFAVGAGPVAAQSTADQFIVDKLTLKDADLLTATRMLTELTGLQFVFEPTTEPFPRVTLNLINISAEDAIRYVCQAAGAYFRRDENGVYIISQTRPVERPALTSTGAPPPKPVVRLHKFKLMKADAEAVYFQLRHGGLEFDPFKGFHEIKRFQEASNLNKPIGHDAGRIYVLGQNAPVTYQPMGNQPVAAPRTNNELGNGIELPGEFGGQGGLAGGGGGGLAGGGGGQVGGGGGQTGGGQTLSPGGLIPEGIDYITFDPNDNSIIIRGTDEQIRQLQDAISFFDTAPRQVTIKVEFITTSSSRAQSFGIDWLYARGGVFAGNRPGTFARAADPIFLNWATGNITTRLRALLQDGHGTTVSSPVVRTLNNQPALVQQGIQTTIFINQIISIGQGNVITQSVPVPFPVTTVLAVRPRINGDGTITMFLTPSIQQLGQLRRGPDGQEIPDVLFQTISIVARVRDGDTIALAGFTQKQDVGSTARFPILGDLPIIGQFFRTSSRDTNYSELLIFVTPTIIDDEDTQGIGP